MQSTIFLTKGICRWAAMIAVILSFCVTACTKSQRPPGILSETEFSSLLVEVYVNESKLLPLHLAKDSAVRFFRPWEESELARRKISRKVLKETYRYYLDHPAEFERIYEIVLDSLSLQQQRVLHQPTK